MCLSKIFSWHRYIDDVLMWSGSEEELREFTGGLGCNPYNLKPIDDYFFLDLMITLTKEGHVRTKLYCKKRQQIVYCMQQVTTLSS